MQKFLSVVPVRIEDDPGQQNGHTLLYAIAEDGTLWVSEVETLYPQKLRWCQCPGLPEAAGVKPGRRSA